MYDRDFCEPPIICSECRVENLTNEMVYFKSTRCISCVVREDTLRRREEWEDSKTPSPCTQEKQDKVWEAAKLFVAAQLSGPKCGDLKAEDLAEVAILTASLMYDKVGKVAL